MLTSATSFQAFLSSRFWTLVPSAFLGRPQAPHYHTSNLLKPSKQFQKLNTALLHYSIIHTSDLLLQLGSSQVTQKPSIAASNPCSRTGSKYARDLGFRIVPWGTIVTLGGGNCINRKRMTMKEKQIYIITEQLVGIRMRIMCLTASTWKVVDRTKWRSEVEIIQLQYSAPESPYCDTMLSSNYPIHGSLSEVNCRSAVMQVVSCQLFAFLSWAVNHLLYLWTCSLAIVFYPPSHPLHAMAPWVARVGKVHKLWVNQYISIVNLLRTSIHTCKHKLRLRPHQHPHDYEPHAKAFSN